IFFAPDWPRHVLRRLGWKGLSNTSAPRPAALSKDKRFSLKMMVLGAFFLLQIFMPVRSMMYKGNQLWAEEGLLGSWKMMLEAKTDAQEGRLLYEIHGVGEQAIKVDPMQEGLTWAQANKVVRNPDLILQFAHYLGNKYKAKAENLPKVYVDAYLGLNGRPIQRFIHPNVDLFAEQRRLWTPYPFVIPIQDSE
ncbi:MAG: HTTM domain-containing protein, partial [Bacteroidota bacterium]